MKYGKFSIKIIKNWEISIDFLKFWKHLRRPGGSAPGPPTRQPPLQAKPWWTSRPPPRKIPASVNAKNAVSRSSMRRHTLGIFQTCELKIPCSTLFDLCIHICKFSNGVRVWEGGIGIKAQGGEIYFRCTSSIYFWGICSRHFCLIHTFTYVFIYRRQTSWSFSLIILILQFRVNLRLA